MTEIRTFELSELQAHPWQVNVPDIAGQEWEEFKADIAGRGVQELIRVSLRTGHPVIVDGHQRVRAARESSLTVIDGIVGEFADEGEEVAFLSSAAQIRRHLTTLQRAKIGMAREAYFAVMARERQKTGKKVEGENLRSNDPRFSEDMQGQTLAPNDAKADSPTLVPNGTKVDERAGRAAKQTAEAIGLSERTYHRAKSVLNSPAAPVLEEAVNAGDLSISAAADLGRRAGTTVNQAMLDKHINALEAAAIERNKDLKRAVESGEKSPREAASMVAQMKAAMEADNKARGTDICNKMEGLLTEIEDVLHDDLYYKVLTSRYNAEEWNGDFAERWDAVVQKMREVARVAQIRAKAIDSEGVVQQPIRTLDALN